MTGKGIDKSEERVPNMAGDQVIIDVRIDIRGPQRIPETGAFGIMGSMELPCHYNEPLASIEKRMSEVMKNAFTDKVEFLILGIRRKKQGYPK